MIYPTAMFVVEYFESTTVEGRPYLSSPYTDMNMYSGISLNLDVPINGTLTIEAYVDSSDES